MKPQFIILTLLLVNTTFAQSAFPDFLQGTWKMENNDVYEHWDKINGQTLKGFSYKIINGQMAVSEYLEIGQRKNELFYTATVLNQNQGKGIEFKLINNDSAYVFENPRHDFPKKIVYKKRTDKELLVHISGEKQEALAYRMLKQNGAVAETDTSTSNPNYDKALAEKLGADDYGMKSYFLVILKTGTNTTTDKAFIGESFRGHLDNIGKLVEVGKLIVAGPLGKNENSYRGIFILHNIASLADAEALLETDPAIKNHLLAYEIFTWYGSAALPEYLPYSDKIWKLKP
ncbi:MAG: hypothetical protein CVU09_07220 [Bacteroidetes bacterium HGW-Bacteroidetes-4]|jgi:uncharacterized protein YciI|nr:MAG: hypothetical protein CVU09_07220 [Bacteroidetes bacterium HGW-Bacteroidetes-4]